MNYKDVEVSIRQFNGKGTYYPVKRWIADFEHGYFIQLDRATKTNVCKEVAYWIS